MNNKILAQKKITSTEIEVLNQLIFGKKNKEIAEALNISVSTVKKHLESIYYKLGVRNRIQAIYVAFIDNDI